MLLEEVQPTRVILLGDLFTKGPDPKGVWKLIKKWNAESVLGNQDDYLVWKYRTKGHRKVSGSAIKISKKTIKWLEQRPLYLEEQGWKAIHAGVNPTGADTFRWIALCIRRWPHDGKSTNSFWWQVYRGDQLIIYGHDAKRGLQDHRPYTLGLDSGCVYGGALTGYILEEDRLVSISSQAVYCPILNKGK